MEVQGPLRVWCRILVAFRVRTGKLCRGVAGFNVHLQGGSEQNLLLTLAALLLACALYYWDGSHSRRSLLESANVVDQSQVLMVYDFAQSKRSNPSSSPP